MKFWFVFPLALLLMSPMWLDRFDLGEMEAGSAGVAEGGVGVPPNGRIAEGGVGVPPNGRIAEGGVGVPPH